MARKILSAEISHETNTFSILPTTLSLYKARRYYRREGIVKALAGTRTAIRGHLDAAEKLGWELGQPLAARAPLQHPPRFLFIPHSQYRWQVTYPSSSLRSGGAFWLHSGLA